MKRILKYVKDLFVEKVDPKEKEDNDKLWDAAKNFVKGLGITGTVEETDTVYEVTGIRDFDAGSLGVKHFDLLLQRFPKYTRWTVKSYYLTTSFHPVTGKMTLTRNYEQVGYKDLSGFFRYSTKPREVASVMGLGHLLYPALWKDHGDDIFTRLLGDLIRYQIKSIMTGHILSIMTNRKISNINSKSDFYYATDGRYIHCRNLRQEWIKVSTG